MKSKEIPEFHYSITKHAPASLLPHPQFVCHRGLSCALSESLTLTEWLNVSLLLCFQVCILCCRCPLLFNLKQLFRFGNNPNFLRPFNVVFSASFKFAFTLRGEASPVHCPPSIILIAPGQYRLAAGPGSQRINHVATASPYALCRVQLHLLACPWFTSLIWSDHHLRSCDYKLPIYWFSLWSILWVLFWCRLILRLHSHGPWRRLLFQSGGRSPARIKFVQLTK